MSDWTEQQQDDWYDSEPPATHVLTWRPVARIEVAVPPWVADPEEVLAPLRDHVDEMAEDNLGLDGLDLVESGLVQEWEGQQVGLTIEGSIVESEEAS